MPAWRPRPALPFPRGRVPGRAAAPCARRWLESPQTWSADCCGWQALLALGLVAGQHLGWRGQVEAFVGGGGRAADAGKQGCAERCGAVDGDGDAADERRARAE